MAQGTRGRLLTVAAAGFGIVLCTGLAGCQNTDKAKDTKYATKQPAPGLPGTPRLDGTGTANRTQQYNYGTPGSTIQQTGGTQVPGAGLGAGTPPYSQTQFGSNGNNPLNTTAPSQNYGPSGLGASNPITAPTRPGMGYSQPPSGPVGLGANPGGSLNSVSSAPPQPQLFDMPLPPPAPNSGVSGASVAVPIAPPGIPPTLPASGAGVAAKQTSTTTFSGAGVSPIYP